MKQLRELVFSFLLRSSVESAVKNTISEARSVTSVEVGTTKKSKKTVKLDERGDIYHSQQPLDNLDVDSSATSRDEALGRGKVYSTTLCDDDVDDLGGAYVHLRFLISSEMHLIGSIITITVITQLVLSGLENGTLYEHQVKITIIEILSVVLRQSLRTSLVSQKLRRKEGSANDPRLIMNIMYFRQSICHWISLIKSIFFSSINQEVMKSVALSFSIIPALTTVHSFHFSSQRSLPTVPKMRLN